MAWTFTTELDELPPAADAWLRGDPTRNTVALTVLARGRSGLWGGGAMAGWYADGESVRGVVLHTPPYQLLVPDIPLDIVPSLAEALRDLPLPGVGGPRAQAEAYLSAAGRTEASRMSMRMYRLAELRPHSATGAARRAGPGDLDLAAGWMRDFLLEAEPENADDPYPQTRARIGAGELVLWEDAGRPVAMAAFSTPIAGMSRVGPVYTPPEHRKHGYGSAVTHAVSRAAKDAGATSVLLFTDLANPTSNAIYQALGYRPLTDYATIFFAAGDRPAG
ncbi:putative acetyltransferase [Sphaerisporangium rufum]|uniref:Acetyltransferase n=1 Tax=Sphaerisporangium rufum TaxID=1381558 RepID=A0A919R895_9ACTN|nr:GNAT family N-acetyltransferase [Sphaerisporangium rufum]GII81038.1 putative acetyltransferase [Sphaerisporangium rufum]